MKAFNARTLLMPDSMRRRLAPSSGSDGPAKPIPIEPLDGSSCACSILLRSGYMVSSVSASNRKFSHKSLYERLTNLVGDQGREWLGVGTSAPTAFLRL